MVLASFGDATGIGETAPLSCVILLGMGGKDPLFFISSDVCKLDELALGERVAGELRESSSS